VTVAKPDIARRGLCALIATVSVLAGCGTDSDHTMKTSGGGQSDTKRPNVVLIIIDTLRADMLSSYGHPADASPALTRITRNAVQFDSVIAQTSWTLPSIGSLLTSQYPRTLGLYDEGDQVLPQHFTTLAEVFQQNSYATFGVTANPNINSRAQFDQGFDEYVDSLVVFVESRKDLQEGEIFFKDSKLNSTNDLFDQAREFAAMQEPKTPVFLQLNLMEVHEYARENMLRADYQELFPGEAHARYLRSVRQVTDDIEQFVQEIESLPGWEDALFCITSDHGEGLTDHPDIVSSMGHGTLLYPSVVHVPWLLFSKAWTPEVTHVTQDVRLLEVVPTVLDLVGIDPPPDVQGVSLKTVILGEQDVAPVPDYIITETYFRHFRKISAYHGNWQYIDNRKTAWQEPTHEIQSRRSVPNGAATNLAGKKPKLVELMRRYVDRWEQRFEEATPQTAGEELPEELRRQLEAIGYTR
jgi:arylsulfatase